MNKIGLIISYTYLKDNDIASFTGNVLQQLTGNTLFEVAAERLEAVRMVKDDYQTKLVKSINGSKLDIMQKNEAKSVLVAQLGGLALDLSVQAKGNREKLATTGFVLVKEPEKGKEPSKPINFKVEYGINDGELIFSVQANKKARMYVFYYTPAPIAAMDTTTWTSIASTSRKQQITGVKRGTEYACRCAYMSADRKPIFSDILMVIAR
jgi:hypothetical protein